MSTEPRDYDPVITGLRAYSIIAVLVFHLFNELLPGIAGYKGVDVFFVISGYLIIGHITKAIEENRFHVIDFYAKRIIRLFPALLILLFLVMAAGYIFMLSDEYASLAKYAFGTIFFFTNILSWMEVNYFDVSAELKPLIHMWSLGVEEQFYATFPLIVVILTTFLKRKILPCLFALTLASAVLCIVISPRMQVATFYLLPTRFWEIGIGGLLAVMNQGVPWFKSFQARSKYNLWLGIVLILVSLTFQIKGYYFFDIVLAVLGAAFILLNTKQEGVGNLILNNKVTDLVGRISYPLYVFHFPIISAYTILGAKFTLEQRIGSLLVLLFFSYGVYRFVEIPVARAPRKIALSVLGMFSLALIAGSAFVVLKSGLPDRIPGNIEFNQDVFGFHNEYREKMKFCSVAEGTICWEPIDSNSHPRIALLGDSHADHLAPSMPVVLKEEGSIFFGTYACPPLRGILSYGQDGKYRCTEMNARASRYVAEQKSIELVILAFAMPFYYTEKGYAFQHLAAGEPMLWNIGSEEYPQADRFSIITRGLRETVDYYLQADKKVVLMIDVPEMPFMPAHCINRAKHLQGHACTVPREVYLQRQKSMRDFIANELLGRKDLYIYDPINVFCDSKVCRMQSDNHYLYRDSNHLSIFGANAVAWDLRNFIAANHIIKLQN